MKIHQKHALIAFLTSAILPIYSYSVATNLWWPDLAWKARQWHQILGNELWLVPIATIFTYFASKSFEEFR